MPPKTRGNQVKEPAQKRQDEDETMESENEDTKNNEDAMSVDDHDNDTNPKKRKSPPTEPASEPDTKAKKDSKPQDASDASHSQSANKNTEASARQILNFLLSEDALSLCYPSQDLEAGKSGKTKTYSLTPPCNFTPFEHLVTAHMLSKPLSHVLGMRSIRTLLNPDYSLNTPSRFIEAGESKIYEALEDAKTQHRQKTASYLLDLAKTYEDNDTMLTLAEEANENGAQGVVEHIKSTVNGMGQTGAEIFCRRIQCVDGWGEAVWPYADPKTLSSLKELGVDVADGNELQELVEEYVDWDKVGQMGLRKLTGTGREEIEVKEDTAEKAGDVEDMDHEQRVQVEFVVLLERAVGAVLEGNAEEVKKRAASA